MTISPVERRIRAGLPVVRFMQSVMPLSVANWLIRQGVARAHLADDMTLEAASAGGVPGYWLVPADSPVGRVLLYLHGGGFVFGLSPPHLQMGAYLARKMGRRIFMVDYRLAPDHPFPAPLDDCATAYRWLLDQGMEALNIAVAGDSAGGNLAITLCMKLRGSGDPLPAAVACLSPVADLAGVRDYQATNDPLLPPRAMRRYSRSYVGDADPRNPLISPVYGDWRGLPPLLIHAGEDEILGEDAARIVQLAEAAGVTARLEIYPRMWHVWQLNLELPQAKQSLDDIAQFLRAHMK